MNGLDAGEVESYNRKGLKDRKLSAVSEPVNDSKDAALAAEGDYQAFLRLYRRHVSQVYSLCARLAGSPQRGVALTEDVFVKAWDGLPTFGSESSFDVWLKRLAIDVVLAREPIGNDPPTPVGPLALYQAIDRLPGDARGIFVLHDVEGYKHPEIAEIFGITIGGSKARLQRARVLLKEALGR